MRRTTRALLAALFLLLLPGLASCGRQEAEPGEPVELYYLNKAETRVVPQPYRLQETEPEKAVEELIGRLREQPEDLTLKPALGASTDILSCSVEEATVTLHFDEHYRELPATTEILTRAALVRTLTQVSGIDYVSVKIGEENLTDAAGNPVGILSADMFIDNAGAEINAYEKTKLRLYFADESGTRLIEAVRPKVYNSNIALEKLVVEELIQGPNNDALYPAINPAAKVVSVTVKDGTCYVNLDEAFLTQPYPVSGEVTIYSIVNSLVELPNVNKVQFSVNGSTDVTLRDNISLSGVFERNLELVGRLEE